MYTQDLAIPNLAFAKGGEIIRVQGVPNCFDFGCFSYFQTRQEKSDKCSELKFYEMSIGVNRILI